MAFGWKAKGSVSVSIYRATNSSKFTILKSLWLTLIMLKINEVLGEI